MRFFVLYGIIPDKGYCNFVRVSEIKGVQNLSNTTTRWVCAKMAYTQGVDTMLIVLKHAEGMSLRYAVPEAYSYVMRCQRLVTTLRCDLYTPHAFLLWCSWTVRLGLEPEGLDFAADGDDVAGGDCAHDEHCHHD